MVSPQELAPICGRRIEIALDGQKIANVKEPALIGKLFFFAHFISEKRHN